MEEIKDESSVMETASEMEDVRQIFAHLYFILMFIVVFIFGYILSLK